MNMLYKKDLVKKKRAHCFGDVVEIFTLIDVFLIIKMMILSQETLGDGNVDLVHLIYAKSVFKYQIT